MKALDRDEVLELLKPYFLLGMSITRACETSNVCDDQTILNWIREDESISRKIKAWQNYLPSKAEEVIATRIHKGDVKTSKWYVERKLRNEYSRRTEITGPDGGMTKEQEALKNIANNLSQLVEKKDGRRSPESDGSTGVETGEPNTGS